MDTKVLSSPRLRVGVCTMINLPKLVNYFGTHESGAAGWIPMSKQSCTASYQFTLVIMLP